MKMLDEILDKHFPEKCFGTIGYCMCPETKREAKLAIISLFKKLIPESDFTDMAGEYFDGKKAGWNYCRNQMIKNIEEL